MSDKTNISYADHTWSPWLGCEPVSPACAHCYASAISKRAGRGAYRHGIQRVLTKDWNKPRRWNKATIIESHLDDACGRLQNPKPRVLVSMCDPFDEEVQLEWRTRFMRLVRETENLTWLLLTKRPDASAKLLSRPDCFWPVSHAWIGVSVENQETANRRIPILLGIPAKVRWLSIEPLLGPIDIDVARFQWIVVGGESGPGHRPMNLEWMEWLVDQCSVAGVPCYVKQDSHRLPGQQGRIPDDVWKIKEVLNV